jgi:16S rRNA (cytidine1402-2'-O)-methyltransferase
MQPSDKTASYVVGGTVIAARPLEPALYLVATPIGNLGDVTLRALETLASCDVLACEDTRVTRVLLDRYGIRRRAFAYHEHNAAEAGARLVAALAEGRSVALVSDAGTPLVSDPGFRLVEQALAGGHRVVPLPGASAALAALTASGLPTDAFQFCGFLPPKDAARRTRLSELSGIQATLVFYEAPQRLVASLASMRDTLGADRRVVVAREITKAFEEFRRATLAELAGHYAEAGAPRGEVVVCVEGADGGAGALDLAPEAVDRMLLELASEMAAPKAAAEAARVTGIAKSDLYRRLVALKERG